MRVTASSLLIILLGGGVLFIVVSILDLIVADSFIFFEAFLGTGFGVPFRFFQLGLFGLSGDYFSISRLVLDWLIWCLIFAGLFHGVRALVRAL